MGSRQKIAMHKLRRKAQNEINLTNCMALDFDFQTCEKQIGVG